MHCTVTMRAYVCVCICVCVCVCVCACMYVHMRTHMHACTQAHAVEEYKRLCKLTKVVVDKARNAWWRALAELRSKKTSSIG